MVVGIDKICGRITKFVPCKSRKLHKNNHFLNHSRLWDKLGQWDPNTFSKIEAQIQSAFAMIALGYYY